MESIDRIGKYKEKKMKRIGRKTGKVGKFNIWKKMKNHVGGKYRVGKMSVK